MHSHMHTSKHTQKRERERIHEMLNTECFPDERFITQLTEHENDHVPMSYCVTICEPFFLIRLALHFLGGLSYIVQVAERSTFLSNIFSTNINPLLRKYSFLMFHLLDILLQ